MSKDSKKESKIVAHFVIGVLKRCYDATEKSIAGIENPDSMRPYIRSVKIKSPCEAVAATVSQSLKKCHDTLDEDSFTVEHKVVAVPLMGSTHLRKKIGYKMYAKCEGNWLKLIAEFAYTYSYLIEGEQNAHPILEEDYREFSEFTKIGI